MAAEGSLTRQMLKERLDSAGVPTAGQALVHLLFRATLERGILREPMIAGQQSFALAEDWIGPQPPVYPRGPHRS